MSADSKELLTKVTGYLSSSGKLAEIKATTDDHDTCIYDSYKLLRELREKIRSVESMSDPGSECRSTEDVSALHDETLKFLVADPPRVLPEDLEHLYNDVIHSVNVEQVVLEINKTLQEVKTRLAQTQSFDSTLTPQKHRDCNFTNDLEKTAASLENLSKHLANFKSIKGDGKLFQKDLQLEDKFKELMHYVELFSKMIESKTKISQANMPTKTKLLGDTALQYDEIMKNLLGSMHELCFLLQNED